MPEDFTSLTHISSLLTNEELTEALTKWFKDTVTFTHWEYVGDTGKGDSYMSEVIRIKIHGKSKNGDPKHVQVILKTIPKSKSRRLTYRSAELFSNEIKFYQIVLPALLEFQATKSLEDPFTNYPRLFLARSDGVEDFIALKDATLEEFGSVAVRQEGIDYEHCTLALKGLAKYHAMSFAMRDQQSAKFKEISDAIFETYYDERFWGWYERFWKRLCSIAIDAVEKEYPGTIYEEKIKEFAVPERYKAMIKAVKDTFSTGVISHGDCWTNNFMFKYENDLPVDVKLIDFQLARCASPILDLSFMIYACTSQEMRLKHYDEFMKYYYEVLAKQVRDMGSDPAKVYSWQTFLGELKKYSFFGLGFSMESTPFIVLAPEDAFNMEMEGDEIVNIDDIWQVGPFKTKEGRLREANNVVHCVDNGFI